MLVRPNETSDTDCHYHAVHVVYSTALLLLSSGAYKLQKNHKFMQDCLRACAVPVQIVVVSRKLSKLKYTEFKVY